MVHWVKSSFGTFLDPPNLWFSYVFFSNVNPSIFGAVISLAHSQFVSRVTWSLMFDGETTMTPTRMMLILQENSQ
jgi:hypothetical protein